MQRKNVTPGPNRASAFLLIAVAIPTFSLILRVIIEAPPAEAASDQGAAQRSEPAKVQAFREKVRAWRASREGSAALYHEAGRLVEEYGGTRLGPELRKTAAELRSHLGRPRGE